MVLHWALKTLLEASVASCKPSTYQSTGDDLDTLPHINPDSPSNCCHKDYLLVLILEKETDLYISQYDY